MSTEFRILVCGGRGYDNQDRVNKILDKVVEAINGEKGTKSVRIIHGAATGADSLAARWAAGRGIDSTAYPADWGAYGKRAGYIRNKQMLEEGKPHAVIAFPGGVGTRMMVGLAKRYGIPVKEYFE